MIEPKTAPASNPETGPKTGSALHDALVAETGAGPEGLQDLLRTVEGRLMVLRARAVLRADRIHPGGGRSRIALLEDERGQLYVDVFWARGEVGAADVAATMAVSGFADAAAHLETLAELRRPASRPKPADAVATLAAYAERARWEVYRQDFASWLGEVLTAWSERASAA